MEVTSYRAVTSTTTTITMKILSICVTRWTRWNELDHDIMFSSASHTTNNNNAIPITTTPKRKPAITLTTTTKIGVLPAWSLARWKCTGWWHQNPTNSAARKATWRQVEGTALHKPWNFACRGETIITQMNKQSKAKFRWPKSLLMPGRGHNTTYALKLCLQRRNNYYTNE